MRVRPFEAFRSGAVVVLSSLVLASCSFAPTLEKNPWTPVSNLKVEADLIDGQFLDSKTAWVVGAKGTVLQTGDGGKTWKSKQISIPKAKDTTQKEEGGAAETKDESIQPRFLSISFAGAQEGWIVGNPRILMHTTDGGKTWFQIALNKRLPGSPLLITATAPKTAEMFTDVGVVYRTQDAGKSWQLYTPSNAGGIKSVQRLADGTYWAVSTRGVSYAQWKPGQDKWQFFERKTSRRIENLGFVSPTNGWVVIQGGNIQFSKDGGKTWDRSVTPDPASGVTLQDVAYVDDKTLWAAGGNGTLYVSLDSGATWKSAPLELRRNLYRIIFSRDKKAGIVLGQNGALLNYQSQIQPS
jgi:photosystem II stability/assembly factor-like uncharacterized protein